MAQFAGKLHGESPILRSETEAHWITSISHVIPEYGGFAVSHLFLSTCITPQGFLGSARLSDYCASKWALLGFAVPWQIKWPSDDSNLHKPSIRFDELRSELATQESLRLELRAQQCSGVGIMAVCPYLVDTQQFDCRHFLLHSSVCSNFPYSRETEEIRGCWMMLGSGLRQLDTDFEFTKLRMFRGAFEGADRSTWFRRCVGWLRCCWLFQLADLNPYPESPKQLHRKTC